MASGARIFVAASMLAATVLAAAPWFELSRVGNMWITRSSTSGPERFDLETYTFFEVNDPGRFLDNSSVFARVRVPTYWALSPHNATVDGEGGRWSTVDLDRCQLVQSSEPLVNHKCHRDGIAEATECTPANPNGCAVDVQLVADGMVELTRLIYVQGYLVATKLREFTVRTNHTDGSDGTQRVNKTLTRRTPSTGVFRVNPGASRMVIGGTVLEWPVDYDVHELHPKPLRFENPISMEALKEPHRAFVLHLAEDGSAVIRQTPL